MVTSQDFVDGFRSQSNNGRAITWPWIETFTCNLTRCNTFNNIKNVADLTKVQLVERMDQYSHFFSSKRVELTFDKLNDPFQHSMSVNFVECRWRQIENGKNRNAKTQ